MDTLMSGFTNELLKLADDNHIESPDPNYPWRANTIARGIKRTADLPSRVPTGHLGEVGSASKSEGTNDAYLKGREQTGDY